MVQGIFIVFNIFSQINTFQNNLIKCTGFECAKLYNLEYERSLTGLYFMFKYKYLKLKTM